ncbi:MAG TPA: dienelactone hydrolase family protein [Patescibacteria group bacterium]|nr:dienelactone hydrolase family protein [Patescibacteria group bacterium]
MELVSPIAAFALTALALMPRAAEDPQQGYTRSAPTAMRSAPTQGLAHIQAGERAVDVYQKKPKGEGTWPGVVMLHDSMGMSRQAMDMVERLSAEGFVVYAPDLYGGRYALDADKGRELSVLMNEEEALLSIEALVAHVRSLPEVGDHRVGVVGFDMGGALALKVAMGSQDLSALAVADTRPKVDADGLRRIGCPILALFAGNDEKIPPADIAGFRAALSAAGRTADLKIFDGVGHGFMKHGDPSYKAEDAGAAWARIVAFFKENL